MAGHIQTAGNVEWCTPGRVLEGVRKVAGGQIGLDPCWGEGCLTDPLVWFAGPPGDRDGLEEPWEEDSIFINPPFGTLYRHVTSGLALAAKKWGDLPLWEKMEYVAVPLDRWVKKTAESSDGKRQLFLLTPANVDTKPWHETIFRTAQAVCFFRGRLKFLGAAASCPTPIALSYWGPKPILFDQVFSGMGRVLQVNPTRGGSRLARLLR